RTSPSAGTSPAWFGETPTRASWTRRERATGSASWRPRGSPWREAARVSPPEKDEHADLGAAAGRRRHARGALGRPGRARSAARRLPGGGGGGRADTLPGEVHLPALARGTEDRRWTSAT